MMIPAIAVIVLILILAITTGSIQIFTNTASAGPKQQQQQQQQLATLASNTNDTIRSNNIVLSSASSFIMNIRPSIQTDFNPNATYPRVSKFA
jgi:hypothetical protein